MIIHNMDIALQCVIKTIHFRKFISIGDPPLQ